MSGELAATFSIVGRDKQGMLGIAVSSCVPAVGARCAFVCEGLVAIACQAYVHPYLAYDTIELLRGGSPLPEAIGQALEADEGREWRQLVAIGLHGAPVAHTGEETDAWAGHRLADDCAAAGNLLVGAETIDAMVETFADQHDQILPGRLVAALAAGEAAGGDRRGRQSAAVLVRATEAAAFVDLRVDDHPDPVGELQRLYALMAAGDLERARLTASSRVPRPISELKQRRAAVHRALEQQRS
jgi:uncharacterized Ntn-hydrolase superfamily protein